MAQQRIAGVDGVVRQSIRELRSLGTPERARGAAAYFKAYEKLAFFGVDSPTIRRMAARIRKDQGRAWDVLTAVTFADAMMARPELEAKALGVCLLAKFRTTFTPAILPQARRWLVKYCTDWASTDTLCGEVIGPLLVANPALVPELRRWRSSTDLYVRRAAAVALIPLVRKGQAVEEAYAAALALGGEDQHLLQKAAGWLLREAGKADMRRLDRFLVAHGPRLSRTTISYAIERFPPPRRRHLLAATRAVTASRGREP